MLCKKHYIKCRIEEKTKVNDDNSDKNQRRTIPIVKASKRVKYLEINLRW